MGVKLERMAWLKLLTDEKVLATAITAGLAPLISGFVLKAFGAEIDVPTLVVILGPIVLGVVTFAVGYIKKDKRFILLLQLYRKYVPEDKDPVSERSAKAQVGLLSGESVNRELGLSVVELCAIITAGGIVALVIIALD